MFYNTCECDALLVMGLLLVLLQGKDRYPYPVGYQSIRAHNGSTYKMEIREGLKGPLFVVCILA